MVDGDGSSSSTSCTSGSSFKYSSLGDIDYNTSAQIEVVEGVSKMRCSVTVKVDKLEGPCVIATNTNGRHGDVLTSFGGYINLFLVSFERVIPSARCAP